MNSVAVTVTVPLGATVADPCLPDDADVTDVKVRIRPGLKRTCVIFPEDLYERVVQAGRADHRCFSPMVVVLVKQALAAMAATPD